MRIIIILLILLSLNLFGGQDIKIQDEDKFLQEKLIEQRKMTYKDYQEDFDSLKSVAVPNNIGIGVGYTDATLGFPVDVPIVFKNDFAIVPFALVGININYLFSFSMYPQILGYNTGVSFKSGFNSFSIGAFDKGSMDSYYTNRQNKGYLEYKYLDGSVSFSLKTLVGNEFRLFDDSKLYNNPDTLFSLQSEIQWHYYSGAWFDLYLENYTHYSYSWTADNGYKNGQSLGFGLYLPIDFLTHTVRFTPFFEYGQGMNSLKDHFINLDNSWLYGLQADQKIFTVGALLEVKYFFLRDVYPLLSNLFLSAKVGGEIAFAKDTLKKSYHGSVGGGLGFSLGKDIQISYHIVYSSDRKLLLANFALQIDSIS